MSERWVEVCAVDDVELEDVIEVDAEGRALAIYRSPQDTFHATDGRCTHQRATLADGLVMGDLIECPKHNGRFNYKTGEAVRVPCLEPLATFAATVADGRVLVALPSPASRWQTAGCPGSTPVAPSSSAASAYRTSSRPWRPTSCTAGGNPSPSIPTGSESAG